ncbi:uncharacterized protein MONOS_16071 [Monocercomonoides exilis]|uniref:uncharacterized protein n=1 Tax=Monocercomonoides exilis TaxID=2049356 RepID=UPI00355A6534|nr:hypothetical protein MONOS_16071 [Monocercomonoides exilis]|eukprot:MONOS_16071.1-p1 / transcript=MONOS_16071.1 / gene=MONOS_16071 / organism=Monocercomonoides_exilis_PA203 / gene_product=unspecified product / transcript_product=unspecified product / location=Mono_scaffold01491:2112-3376(+) / protein_length=301 / sequence_SO=supercontig / SO=protein_coding / is_pseudo=false
MTPPRSEERGECVQMEKAKTTNSFATIHRLLFTHTKVHLSIQPNLFLSLSFIYFFNFGAYPSCDSLEEQIGQCKCVASSSLSATRDVFDPQSILLNYAAYVASQEILVGGEKEKEWKKDEKRSANEFVRYKYEKGSLCLTDKCIDNKKNEEEEEEDGFDKDIRKAQKKLNGIKGRISPYRLKPRFAQLISQKSKIQEISSSILSNAITFSTFPSAYKSSLLTSSSFLISSPSSPSPSSSSSFSLFPTNLLSIKHSLGRSFKEKRWNVIELCAGVVFSGFFVDRSSTFAGLCVSCCAVNGL